MIPNIKIKPLLSKQGEILSIPDKAQVHFLKTFPEDPDFFALVVNVNDEFCDVVPGCFDAMQAGPDDIFIPEEVLGEPVMLAIGSLCTISRTAIGDGFATLDRDTYNNIITAVIKYEDGIEDIGFDRGYKYLSENDPRIETHHRMLDGFIAAQRNQMPYIKINWREYKAAAAPLYQEHLLSYTIKSKTGFARRLKMLVKEGKKRIEAVIVREDGEVTEEYDNSFLVDGSGNLLGRFTHGRMSFTTYNGMSIQFCSLLDDFMPVELNSHLCT